MKAIKRLLLLLVILASAAAGASAQKTYVVSVGLGKYQDNWASPLSFAPGDARSLAKFFNKHRDCEVFMLLNDNATRDHILRVLRSMFSKATPKDEIIFIFSGHGFDGGVGGYNKDEFVYCSEVQDIMKRSRAGRKVMFMQSCHSGSFSKKYNNDSDRRGRGNYKSSASNVMLYMSSRANEYSWGIQGASRSFFMNRLLQGLEGGADNNGDNKVTARELFNFVNRWVIADSDGAQHPQMYGKFDDDMVIVNLN